jgi:hypothetical protein
MLNISKGDGFGPGACTLFTYTGNLTACLRSDVPTPDAPRCHALRSPLTTARGRVMVLCGQDPNKAGVRPHDTR